MFEPSAKYTLILGDHVFKCSMGRAGIKPAEEKEEDDGSTPAGEFYFRKVFYRPDKIKPEELKTELETSSLEQDDGWCDDGNSEVYNQHIKLPFDLSHEKLWREEDNLYDIIVVIGYNDDPPEKNKGSAIFMHLAKEGYQPTAGCIALSKDDLLKVIEYLTPESSISIDENGTATIKNIPSHTNNFQI